MHTFTEKKIKTNRVKIYLKCVWSGFRYAIFTNAEYHVSALVITIIFGKNRSNKSAFPYCTFLCLISKREWACWEINILLHNFVLLLVTKRSIRHWRRKMTSHLFSSLLPFYASFNRKNLLTEIRFEVTSVIQ